MSAKLAKPLTEAEDRNSIRRLATDLHKRELFKKLGFHLRAMARDIQAVLATHGEISASIRLD